jgi:putative ABC transport system permease protein
MMVALLAVCIGLALIMATVHGATQNQLGSIGTQIGTQINIWPAGFGGLIPVGGGKTLAQKDIDKLSEIDHVASVQASVETVYKGKNLKSAVGDGSQGGDGSPGGSIGSSIGGSTTLDMPIAVMGFDAATKDPKLMGDLHMEITKGRYFTVDENDADVMVVGKDLAEKNNLSVGSTVDIEGTPVTVIGIYDSGTVWGNNVLVMPIGTAERLFKLDGPTSVIVEADNVRNVDKVVDSIREVLPEDVADIVTAKDMYERINGSVTNAESTSTIGMIVAFVVAGVVVLFSVVLMMRQRVKEIGILKAIGASNRRIGLQFSLETLAVSVVGAIIGALITYPLAQKVADLMVGGNSTGVVAGGGSVEVSSGSTGLVGGSIGGLHVAVSPTVFLYALAIAAALAIVASVLPAWYIGRVKPAEVLRNE